MQSSAFDDPDFAPADPAKATWHAIRGELADGERLAWLGRPRRPGPASWGPTIALSVGIGWGAMGLIVLLAGLSDLIGGRDITRDVGAIVAVGTMLGLAAVLLCGSWAWAKLGPRDRVTAYALTDRRIILREPLPFGRVRVRSLHPRDLGRISRVERADGSGTIVLEGTGRPPNGVQAANQGASDLIALGVTGQRPYGVPAPTQLACLGGLDRVREVEALIRATLLPD